MFPKYFFFASFNFSSASKVLALGNLKFKKSTGHNKFERYMEREHLEQVLSVSL